MNCILRKIYKIPTNQKMLLNEIIQFGGRIPQDIISSNPIRSLIKPTCFAVPKQRRIKNLHLGISLIKPEYFGIQKQIPVIEYRHILFTDGGSRGNPGPSAGASVIYKLDKDTNSLKEIASSSTYIGGNTTCSVAEYDGIR